MIGSIKNGYSSNNTSSNKSLVSELTKALDPKQRKNQPKSMPRSVLESSKEYQEKLEASRQNKTNTSNAKKKVQYSHKLLSAAILRSKTSQSARLAASKARREVNKLKAKAQTGDYDQDEIQLAISHAKAMEIAAKKKAKNLAAEEMVKISDKASEMSAYDGSGDTKELEDSIKDSFREVTASSEEVMKDAIASSEEMVYDATESVEDMLQLAGQLFGTSMEDFGDEMSELTAELLDELDDLDMDELFNELVSDMKPEMTEEDFKKAVIKHRNDEHKLITLADSEYLKGLFDHYQTSSVEFNMTV